jgi:sec-independent protein translocase protein TatC
VGWNRHAENPEKALPLLGHLEELRTRLITCVVAISLGCVIGWFLGPFVLELLKRPIEESGLVHRNIAGLKVEVSPDGSLRFPDPASLAEINPDSDGLRRIGRIDFHLPGQPTPIASWEGAQPSGVIYLKPTDPVMIRFKAALIIGVVIAIPIILYQIYAFISPGLYPTERAAVRPIFFGGLLLFPVGAAFAYFMLKYALIFLASFATSDVYIFNDMRAYLSLALTTMLAFGLLFQMPIVIMVLTRLGIVSVDWLAERRKVIGVGLLIVSAAVTPPDPFTMLALAIPLYFLFELSIVLSRLQGSRIQAAAEAETEPKEA